MKYSLKQHPYFKLWENPSNGIGSYILEKRIAPIQQPFYSIGFNTSPLGATLKKVDSMLYYKHERPYLQKT